MNMNAFFRKLWQSREDQRAQEQKLAQEREDQYVEQATREWLGEGQSQPQASAPAQEVTGLEQAGIGIEQPPPEPSQTPAQPQAAADLDDELEME